MASSALYSFGSSPASSSHQTSAPRHHKPRIPWAFSMLLAVCFASGAAATELPRAITAPVAAAVQPAQTLLMDTRLPVMVRGHWMMLSDEENRMRRRQDDDSPPPATTTASPTESDSPSSSRKDATTLTISMRPPTSTTSEIPSPLPSPFDGNLAYNFTGSDGSSCPRFINDLLTSPSFKRCYPLSMMLQGSTSFFEAQRKLVSIVKVLDATCAADVRVCTDFMNNAARNLTSDANCGSDYRLENPIVVQAYLGLKSYQMLYAATCLQDRETSMYCYANAVTNLTTPSNVYFYYLPLNMTLPGSATPSCSTCMQETMGIFHSAAADRKQAVAWTYAAAAKQVNTICGPGFVNDTMPAPLPSMAGLSKPLWTWTATAAALAILANFI